MPAPALPTLPLHSPPCPLYPPFTNHRLSQIYPFPPLPRLPCATVITKIITFKLEKEIETQHLMIMM